MTMRHKAQVFSFLLEWPRVREDSAPLDDELQLFHGVGVSSHLGWLQLYLHPLARDVTHDSERCQDKAKTKLALMCT
jgi:hypothetical protein